MRCLWKDDKKTLGIRSTCGAKIYANPEWANDFQSYNDVAGATNNPWNPARTSGGSTGGGAAALACGMGFLELGSDIGGSIRTPSHFCGVFGHKPTIDVIADEGFVDPPNASPAPDRLSLNGPLARSPQDLLLGLQIADGTRRSPAHRVLLEAAARARRAAAGLPHRLRVGRAPDVRQQVERTIDALGKAGARLEQGWPAGMRIADWHGAYVTMLGAAVLPNDPTPHRAWERRSSANMPRAAAGPITSAAMTLS